MASDIFRCFLLQTAFTVGSIFLFGFLIGWCNRRFYANFGRYGRKVCILTGIVGTPVHEGAHALACLLFGHRIQEIRLFSINPEDGVLGYVRHSCNPRNFYHRIGNFFIGTAPVVVISLLFALIAYLLLPEMFLKAMQEVSEADFGKFGTALAGFWNGLSVIFSYADRPAWWGFLFLGILFCLHMSLSKADVKGALDGLFFLLLLYALTDIVLGLLGDGILFSFTRGFLSAAGFMTYFLLIALLLSVCAVAISWVFRALKRR